MKRSQGTITASACSTWFSCPRSQCRWASPSPLSLDRAPGARSCGRSEGQTVSPALGRRLMSSPPNREPCSHGGHSACVCMCTRVLSHTHTHTHTPVTEKSNPKAATVTQTVKDLPAIPETQAGSQVGKIPWRTVWLPIPVFMPGEFHGQRSLVGYIPWGHKELDMTDRLTVHTS